MSRWMTDDEIVVLYRQALNPAKEIRVLAELNACPREQIEDVLIAAGYKIKRRKRIEAPPAPSRRVRYTAGQIEQAQRMRACGCTLKEIASAIGGTVSGVGHITRRREKRNGKRSESNL